MPKSLGRLTAYDQVLTANDIFDPVERPHGKMMALKETKNLVDHSTQAHIFATKGELEAFVEEQKALPEGSRSVKVGDNLYITDTGVPDYWWMGEAPWISELETGAVNVTVDSALNACSNNPVQNKVVKAALDNTLKKDGSVTTDAGVFNWALGYTKVCGVISGGWGTRNSVTDLNSYTTFGYDRIDVARDTKHEFFELTGDGENKIARKKDLEGLGGGGFDPASLIGVEIGQGSVATGNCGVAVGYGASANSGVTVGYSALSCNNSVAVGSNALAMTTSGGVAVGPHARAGESNPSYTPSNATAVGSLAVASREAAVAIGDSINVTTPGVTIVGSGSWGSHTLSSYVMGKVANGAYEGEGVGDLLRTSWLVTARSCALSNGPHKGAAIGVYSATCAAFGSYDNGVGLAFVVTGCNGIVCANESFVLPSCKLKALADGTIGGGGDSGVEVWTGTVNASGPEEFVGSKNLGTDDSPKYARWHNRGEDIHAVSGFSNETDTHWNHRFIIPWELARTNDSTYMATNVKWQGNRSLIQMGDETTFVQPLMPANTGNTSSVFPYAIPAFEESPVYWSGTIIYNDTVDACGTYTDTAKMVSVPWEATCTAETAYGGYSFLLYRKTSQAACQISDGVTVAVSYRGGGGGEIVLASQAYVNTLSERIAALETKLAAVGA